MPFFPQAYVSPDHFISLLNELDQPQQQKGHCSPRQCRPQQTLNPKFDVAEVANAYELFGELPGVEQKDITIEFSDAQTILIKGKVDRLTATTTPAVETTPAPFEEAKEDKTDTSSEKSLNATVEDEYDEVDTPLTAPATVAHAPTPEKQQEQQQPPEAKTKFWVAERKVGTFARTFSFSQRIEQDTVQASLKNGILHVVISKSQKSRKINVTVA